MGILFSYAASAETYLVNNKPVSVEIALNEAIKGKEVLQCKTVVASLSKSGKSITLKTKKIK